MMFETNRYIESTRFIIADNEHDHLINIVSISTDEYVTSM
jgi:hypothetical protein